MKPEKLFNEMMLWLGATTPLLSRPCFCGVHGGFSNQRGRFWVAGASTALPHGFLAVVISYCLSYPPDLGEYL